MLGGVRSSTISRQVLVDVRALQGPSARRGIGTYARGLLGGLVAEGFDAHMTLLIDAELPSPDLPAGAFDVQQTRRRGHGRLALYEDALALQRDLARSRPALFHALTLAQPWRSHCPVAVTLHDLIPWALGGLPLLGERVRYWPGRRLLRRARLVLTVSEATAADAERLAGIPRSRIQVVPHGIAEAFQPVADAGRRVRARWGLQAPYLVYVGALDARKDPAGLLRAWEVARRSRSELDLVLAGEPGAQAPGRMANARRLGHLSEAELAELLSAAVCLVFPSRYEGFGLPALEAMACGCPVVAYRNSSLPEVVGEAGVLVTDGDADELGRQAAAIAADGAWRKQLSKAGLARAQRFTWRETARRTIAGYEGLLR
jgi:glycosyltransferase involved in cell wall biosynthesis